MECTLVVVQPGTVCVLKCDRETCSSTISDIWLVTESYGYRRYDAVPRMMQETQAAHRCEET